MRAKRRITLGALVVALLLVSVPPLANPASAQETQQALRLTHILVNNTIEVNTTFYDLKYDAREGGITYLRIRDDFGVENTLITPNATKPLLQVTVNNTVLNNGNLTIVGEMPDRMLVLSASYTTPQGESIEVMLTLYSWTPLISVSILANSSMPNTEISLVAYNFTDNITSVKRVYLYRSGSNISKMLVQGVGEYQIPEGQEPIVLGSATIRGNATQNQTANASLLFFYGTHFIEGLPTKFAYTTLGSTSGTNETFDEITIYYNNTNNIKFDFMAASYIYAITLSPPFPLALDAAFNIDNYLFNSTRIGKTISELNNRITGLNNQITNLSERIQQLNDNLSYCEGQIDHYKQEVLKWKNSTLQCESLRKKTGLVEIGVFIIGVILGVIAGAYLISYRK
ncbi:MAG: hypothetical protein F7C35_02890 [Desulfurococcales archaeon]|nr:hypothetical protein [Desulfurococcales archaeon]